MKRMRIAVLMGGKSPEYEVSLASGREVVKNLDPHKYEVLPVVVSRDGQRWEITAKEKLLDSPAREESRKIFNFQFSIFNDFKRRKKLLTGRGVGKDDLVFIAMHGPYGEDGIIQGMLEVLGLPYAGSGVLASALGMNKVASRKLWQAAGVLVPRFEVVESQVEFAQILKKFKFPFVVKPAAQGSSIGVTIVHQKSEAPNAFKKAAAYGDTVIVEEYIKGKEVTCGILGNENPTPLP